MSETLRELSRLLKESKVKITALNAESKAEGQLKEDYEKRLVAAMDAAGTTTVANEFGNFNRNEAIMPVVKDWELVYDYIRANDAFYLLYKQLGANAYRELLDVGENVPGVETYNRITISVTKAKGT